MRFQRAIACTSLALALPIVSSATHAQNTPLRTVTSGVRQTYTGGDITFGMLFTANSNVGAYALGMWLPTAGAHNTLGVGANAFVDNDPSWSLASSYEVGLYNSSMTLLGMATIRPDLSTAVNAAVGGQIWYTTLTTPLQMIAGQQYRLLAAASPNSGTAKDIANLIVTGGTIDDRVGNFAAPQGADHVSVSNGLPVPSLTNSTGPGRFGPTMLLSDPVISSLSTPEPSTIVMMVSGLLAIGVAGLRRRK